MDDSERIFLNYLKIKEIKENRKIIQKGGIIERVKVGIHNIEYDLRINKSRKNRKNQIDLIALSTAKSDEKQPCFIMSISPGYESVLISLSRGLGCFLDKSDDSAGIVLAALKIAKIKGAKTFEFTDNSVKFTDGKKIKLADLSFLTTGKTWYEHILTGIKLVDVYDRKDIEDSRNVVLQNKWSDVYKKLIDKNVFTNFDTMGIDINSEGSARMVLERAKKSKLYADFFQNHMGALIKCSGISSLHEKHWIMDVI